VDNILRNIFHHNKGVALPVSPLNPQLQSKYSSDNLTFNHLPKCYKYEDNNPEAHTFKMGHQKRGQILHAVFKRVINTHFNTALPYIVIVTTSDLH